MDFKKWYEFRCAVIFIFICTCEVVLSQGQCTPGLGTPGYTIPHGDIVIEYGASLDIMCVLVNGTQSNGSLIFIKNSNKLPSEMIDVVNSTAIQLHIEKPAKASGDMYTCEQVSSPKNKMICMNYVTVGIKPQAVTDFDCISHNFDNLTCTWTAPKNYVNTEYNLTYSLGGRSARFGIKCPHIKKSDTSNRMSCFWNVSTTPAYRQVHPTYTFNLTMTNQFGSNSINKIFNHFAHVLPGPPENLTVISTTPSSIYLYWELPFSMQSFPPGVHHRILYQCEYGERKWHHGGLILSPQSRNMTFNLTNLTYAHALCDIRVSLRSAKALPEDESMWSKNASITERTSSKVPDAPPETNVGSFEIVAFGNSLQNREAYIYWKQVPEEQKNGPNFKYKIVVEGNSSIISNETTNIYAKFKDLSISKNYTFHIWSENANGSSVRRSTVYVPRQIDRVKEPRSFTKVEFKDGEYELTWEPPELGPNQFITNYTIFYCRNDRDRPYQCNGMLNWKIVSNDTTSVNMQVEKEKIFQFAISANTHNSSSGMLWAACTVIHNKNMGKMKTVWIDQVGSTFIEVRWKLDCSDRIGSVEGYIVYYCPIKSPLHTECKADQRNITFNGTSIQGGNITNLNPYTTYMLTVSVITKHTTFSQQSDPLYNTTLEAAPSPPRNLRVVNITNSTITLVWDSPAAINGILKYYEIEYFSPNDHLLQKRTGDSNYTLSDLKSFERYNITVTACTVSCSKKVITTELTSVGYPSRIQKPTVDRRNGTSITITWNPPSEPGGNLDHYVVQFKQKHKNDNKTLDYMKKTRKFVIENCGDGGKFNTFYISVKAVNKIKDKNYSGPWSDELENYCETPVNYIMYILLFVVIGILIFLGFISIKLYHQCKMMSHVEVKLPPGLAPVVADHALVAWSTEKHQENHRASYSAPEEGYIPFVQTANTGYVVAGIKSPPLERQESRTSYSQPDEGHIPLVQTANAGYVLAGMKASPLEHQENRASYSPPGEGYIPFVQTANTGYVVAGIKNSQLERQESCASYLPPDKGYIPFDKTATTGYVMAGVKNCKLD